MMLFVDQERPNQKLFYDLSLFWMATNEITYNYVYGMDEFQDLSVGSLIVVVPLLSSSREKKRC